MRMKSETDENSKSIVTFLEAWEERVTAMTEFLNRANQPRGLSLRKQKMELVNSFKRRKELEEKLDGKDWKMFNYIYPKLKRINPTMAEKLKAALKHPNITKKFYDPATVVERYEDFVSKDTKPMNGRPNFEKACKDIAGLMGDSKLEALKLDKNLSIERVFTNKKASAGSIYPGKKKDEIWDLIFEVAVWYKTEKPKDNPFPTLPFARAQISGFLDEQGNLTPEATKHKQRLVWCINASVVLVEALYARPMMDEVLPRISQYAGGKAPREIRRKLRRWGTSWSWVCLDYSKYDSTVPKWIIKRVFEMIKGLFDEKEHSTIDWICYEFIHTKIIMPDGTIKQKCKGIPSGSYFTQIVGSLVNMLMIRTWQYSLYGDRIDSYTTVDGIISFMVMGDDNIVFMAEEINRKKLSSYLKKNFGVIVHGEKCDYGTCFDDPVFLKRTWMENGEWRDPLELFINMCHPERFRKYDTYQPIHILYGYYLAYSEAIRPFFNLGWLRKELIANGGAAALSKVPDGALPGSLYWIKITNPMLFDSLVQEIEKEEAMLA